jgi:hypothetical protein
MVMVNRIVQDNKLPCSSLEFSKESMCDACQQGKSHQLPFPKSFSVSQAPLELVHSDVWGLPQHLLEGKIIMLALLLILASMSGFISYDTNQKYSKSFTPSNPWLNIPSIEKS